MVTPSFLARAPQFDDTLVVVEIDCQEGSSTPDVVISTDGAKPASGSSVIAPRLSDEAEMWQGLVIGLRDYITKNGFKSVVVGLSGGIDSALVAAIAIDALGAMVLPCQVSIHPITRLKMPKAWQMPQAFTSGSLRLPPWLMPIWPTWS